ncbi:MAG: hypothetical protein K2N94_14810, partial [Lachnospiraceae bacterium]|nr:hypothetical protein [Lachnospiraceae bacterium]
DYDFAALPMHIYYSAQIRDELAENGQILLGEKNMFQICIRRRGDFGFGMWLRESNAGDSIVYICGGELS